MIIEIAVQHEWIRRCKCSAGAHQRIGFLASLKKLIPKGALVAKAEEAVHLFTIDSRWELAQLGKGPPASKVRVIAFIEFESRDADVDQVSSVIVAKDPTCLGVMKVRHETAPYSRVSSKIPHGIKER